MPNPMKAIAAPHFEKAPVEPFSKDDLEPLLGELKVVLPSNMLAAAMERDHSPDLNAVVQEWLDQPE